MLNRSPSPLCSLLAWSASVILVTGWLSPVRAASSISRFAANKMRPSAGIRSPASTKTTSPGTIWCDGTIRTSPSRRTLASPTTIFCSASRAASALCSWKKPMMAFVKTTIKTTSGVFISCDTTALTMAAPIKIKIRVSLNCATNFFQAGTTSALGNSLSPCCACRSMTTSCDNPVSTETSWCSQTSPTLTKCGSLINCKDVGMGGPLGH